MSQGFNEIMPGAPEFEGDAAWGAPAFSAANLGAFEEGAHFDASDRSQWPDLDVTTLTLDGDRVVRLEDSGHERREY